MAQQQGLAFTSGGEAQESIANPAEPAQTHHDHVRGEDRPSSAKAFEQLRRFSSMRQHQKAAAAGGITSRQAIFPTQVQPATYHKVLNACCGCIPQQSKCEGPESSFVVAFVQVYTQLLFAGF